MSTRTLFYLFGASIFQRTHKINLSPVIIPPIRFTKPFPSHTLRFHCYSSSSADILYTTTTATFNTDTAKSTVHSDHPWPDHPWPEWVTFVDRLKTKGYLLETPPLSAAVDYGDMNLLKDPCLSFARDRFDIFKSLSRQDIQTVVEKGCPNLFRKVVNSAKRLRAYVGLDEGDACSACSMRGSCDRAYVIVKESEAAARTVDLVRVLLSYALDPLVITVGKKPPGRELVEVSARKLLSELIEMSDKSPVTEFPKPAAKATQQKKQSIDFMDDELSRDVEMKRGDWMCPKCNFLNFSKNIRCLKCGEDGPKRVGGDDVEMKKGDWVCPECTFMNFARNVRCLKCKTEGPKRVGVDDVEMKKGDWNCIQCGFMNFASNTKCLRCRELRPKRQLNPGEWECPSCGFLNFRGNKDCRKCDCERPKESETGYEDQIWKKPF